MSLTTGNKAPRRPGQQVESKCQLITGCHQVTSCKASPSRLLHPPVTSRTQRHSSSAAQLNSVPSRRPGRARGSKGATHFTEEETEARQDRGSTTRPKSWQRLDSNLPPTWPPDPSLARAPAPPVALETARARANTASPLPPAPLLHILFFFNKKTQGGGILPATERAVEGRRYVRSPPQDADPSAAPRPPRFFRAPSRRRPRAAPHPHRPSTPTPSPSPAHLPLASPWQRPHRGRKKKPGALPGPLPCPPTKRGAPLTLRVLFLFF